MPPFYEDAAHLLHRMTRAGLVIRPGVDPRAVVLNLATYLDWLRDYRGTHFEAANWVLQGLEATGMAAAIAPAVRSCWRSPAPWSAIS